MNDTVKKIEEVSTIALGVATALTTVLEGLALSPAQAGDIKAIIARLEGLKAPARVTINKSDIKEAVERALPALLKPLIADAVNAELVKHGLVKE